MKRKHFKVLYERDPRATKIDDVKLVFEAAQKEFDSKNVLIDDQYAQKGGPAQDFPVERRDKSIVSSVRLSKMHIPPFAVGHVFINPQLFDKARIWLDKEKARIINLKG